MIPLTAKQQTAYKFIAAHIRFFGQAPTRAEIARVIGHKFPSSVNSMLSRMVERGWIRLVSGVRNIEIVSETTNAE